MKASPLCQHSVAGSEACSAAWDKNIRKAHHFLTSPLQHFLPKAVFADSSAVTATSDLQPHPANTLGAHVLMQALPGGGGTYSDSLKPVGIAQGVWDLASSEQSLLLTLKHKGAESVCETTLCYSSGKKLVSCDHNYTGAGPCWRSLYGFVLILK